MRNKIDGYFAITPPSKRLHTVDIFKNIKELYIEMKYVIYNVLIIVLTLVNVNCASQKPNVFNPKVVYQSEDLIVTQVTKSCFEHTSYIQTNDFGNVPCNGLIVVNSNEAIIFDTPTNDKSSAELIKWIKQKLRCKINAIIPTHFHNDCLGGLRAFDIENVPSYANFKTIELAKQNNYTVPKNGFRDSLILEVGKETVIAKFFGEGHTKDNVIGYFPGEKVMFGGCLVKELNAGKGYLGDANVSDWSGTVERVKAEYPNAKIIVPGHGKYGDRELLDYTINLFRTQ